LIPVIETKDHCSLSGCIIWVTADNIIPFQAELWGQEMKIGYSLKSEITQNSTKNNSAKLSYTMYASREIYSQIL